MHFPAIIQAPMRGNGPDEKPILIVKLKKKISDHK